METAVYLFRMTVLSTVPSSNEELGRKSEEVVRHQLSSEMEIIKIKIKHRIGNARPQSKQMP